MNSSNWHKGPPPSIGWWPASASRDPNALRWWDGKYWSSVAYAGDSLNLVKAQANKRLEKPLYEIEWTDRPNSWPAQSYT